MGTVGSPLFHCILSVVRTEMCDINVTLCDAWLERDRYRRGLFVSLPEPLCIFWTSEVAVAILSPIGFNSPGLLNPFDGRGVHGDHRLGTRSSHEITRGGLEFAGLKMHNPDFRVYFHGRSSIGYSLAIERL